MATGTKICKICGKEYECCKTVRHIDGVFRWQDVACCVEHGQEYLSRVLAARSETPAENASEEVEREVTPQKKATRRKVKAEE